MTMQAAILAGGLGTRIRAVAGGLPKAMLPIGKRPFIELVLGRLSEHGFSRVALALGYKAEAIREHLGGEFAGLELHYHVEESPLGTGGALAAASRLLDADPFFAMNGDTWLEVDYQEMASHHAHSRADVTIATASVPDVARYGALEIEDGRIVGFREKGEHGPGRINGGVYLIRREVIGATAQAPCSFERDVLERRIRDLNLQAFAGASGPEAFIDIGVPEDLERARSLFDPA